jgi:predicted RNA binding protein YcfA (HicA-like mRNA interferase family)
MAKAQKYKDVVKTLRSKGWVFKRQTGSHELWGPENSVFSFPLAQHKGEISPGVMRKLLVAVNENTPTAQAA